MFNGLVLDVRWNGVLGVGLGFEAGRASARRIQIAGPSVNDSHDRRIRLATNQFYPFQTRTTFQALNHLAYGGGQSWHREVPPVADACSIDLSRAKEKSDCRPWRSKPVTYGVRHWQDRLYPVYMLAHDS